MKKASAIFIGLSHLGLVSSIGWASFNKSVIGIDGNEDIVNSLNEGKILAMEDNVILNEPGLQELYNKVRQNYYPTTDFSEISKSSLVFFAKDTPKVGKNPEKEIFRLIEKVTPFFKENVSIVIMSQVPIGFCRNVQEYIKKSRPEITFNLYHWVDTIVMTSAVNRFLQPERIIIGMNETSKELSKELADGVKLFHSPLFKMSFESAELTKAAINLYLANSVTYANTLSDYAEAVGANINEIIPALRTDKRIGPTAYIKPNLRIAGGHLERDLYMLRKLAKNKKISSGSVGFIIKQNNSRYKWAIQKLKNIFKTKKTTICIWGLSYKKDSTSIKNASSLEIIKSLKGKATIRVYDPMAIIPQTINGYQRFSNKYEALKNSDSLLILTAWNEFEEVSIVRLKELMAQPIIIDAIGILEKRRNELKNFTYISMGTE